MLDTLRCKENLNQPPAQVREGLLEKGLFLLLLKMLILEYRANLAVITRKVELKNVAT